MKDLFGEIEITEEDRLSLIIKGVSEEEIKAREVGNGGFSYARLRAWGVPIPPPKGWKKKLIENWRASVTKRD